MAYTDLTTAEKQELAEFLRNYRAAQGEIVRGLRMQSLLLASYTASVSTIWAKVVDSDLIPDDSGLSGADHTMTKAQFAPMLTWTANLLAGIYAVNGGAVATVWPTRATVDGYGVQLAGPTNIG
jgi:hypothetical protein